MSEPRLDDLRALRREVVALGDRYHFLTNNDLDQEDTTLQRAYDHLIFEVDEALRSAVKRAIA